MSRHLSIRIEAPVTHERFVGAFVFPDVWADLAGFRSLLAVFRDCGINALVTESETYDAAAIDAVHELGLQFYAGVACFSDHATNFARLAARPQLWPILETGKRRPQMEWYVGISPTNREHQQAILSLVGSIGSSYEVDGLFLDFVRWPLHWEIELRPGRPSPPDSSFDTATLQRFADATGVVPPSRLNTIAARATWIREYHRQEWIDFKCEIVTAFVDEAKAVLRASRPAAELGIFIVPEIDGWTEPLTGQRLEALAPLADWVSPMLYHNILLQPPTWISGRIAEVVRFAGSKTLPVVQADSNRDPSFVADWGPPMPIADWQATLSEVEASVGIAGLIVFPGTSLLDNGRSGALRTMLRRG
jgi:hypothetical protein